MRLPSFNPKLCKTVLLFLICYSVKSQNAFTNDGAAVYLESSAAIHIEGHLENKGSGSFSNAGIIHITGNLFQNGSGNLNESSSGLFRLYGSATQFINGTKVPDFYNLTIDKPAGECHLQTGISLSNELTFVSGKLFLNNQQVDLLTTGRLLNESQTNRAYDNANMGTGTIKVVNNLNAPNSVNPGNLGASITSPQNMGLTTIVRGHKAQLIVSTNSIERYYEISPANNSSLNASLVFNYFDAELNGQQEDDLVQWHLPDESAVWLKRGGTINNAMNFVSLNSIDSFNSRVSLVSRNTIPLPVKLIEFTATKTNDQKVLLSWKTADETAFSRFHIERSVDGFHWEKIGSVTAAGTIGSIQHYKFIDALPFPGLNYYRLKQIDLDERFVFSVIRVVNFENDNYLQIYPTLTKSNSQIFIKGTISGMLTTELYDNKGSLLFKTTFNNNNFQLPALIPGKYLIRITDNASRQLSAIQHIIIF
jgi:hypothetical protein